MWHTKILCKKTYHQRSLQKLLDENKAKCGNEGRDLAIEQASYVALQFYTMHCSFLCLNADTKQIKCALCYFYNGQVTGSFWSSALLICDMAPVSTFMFSMLFCYTISALCGMEDGIFVTIHFLCSQTFSTTLLAFVIFQLTKPLRTWVGRNGTSYKESLDLSYRLHCTF